MAASIRIIGYLQLLSTLSCLCTLVAYIAEDRQLPKERVQIQQIYVITKTFEENVRNFRTFSTAG